MNEPGASVIVCTRNRASSLRRALEHLGRQKTQGLWELVIVDNGSTDDTSLVLRDFLAEYGSENKDRIAFAVAIESQPGLANARNSGLNLARGRILIFTDDDCYAPPDFVESWLSVFHLHPDLDFAAGRIELHDQKDARMTVRTDPHAHRLPKDTLLPRGYLQGANMACRRKLVEVVGRFDPLFGAGAPYRAGEDTDYFQRAINKGFVGGYEPGPLIYHHHGRKEHDRRELYRQYDTSYGANLLKAMLTNPKAVVARALGRDAEASFYKAMYWDLLRRGFGPGARYWASRWWYGAQGAAQFALNACVGRHRGYW